MPVVKTIKQHVILLDMHVFLWFMEGNPKLKKSFRNSVERQDEGKILISAISIWEIGMLVEKNRISIDMDVLEWVEQALLCPLLDLVPLSPEIAIQSSRLPGTVYGDPADRMLIATARKHNAVLATCDEKLLLYGKDRFISVHNPA